MPNSPYLAFHHLSICKLILKTNISKNKKKTKKTNIGEKHLSSSMYEVQAAKIIKFKPCHSDLAAKELVAYSYFEIQKSKNTVWLNFDNNNQKKLF